MAKAIHFLGSNGTTLLALRYGLSNGRCPGCPQSQHLRMHRSSIRQSIDDVRSQRLLSARRTTRMMSILYLVVMFHWIVDSDMPR